ncbi:guanylate kinase [Pelomyxa schiedti]|nr:guanylate kinase [Pelomyxa schiedti]
MATTHPSRTTPINEPLFVVISGPSGCGKTCIINEFMSKHSDFVRCLSVTTRAPRGTEKDGVDYWFVSEEEFQRRIDTNAFLEYAKVFGRNNYGTPRDFVESNLAAGRSVIKDMDVQGALQVKRNFPKAMLVFVNTPTREILEERLRGRGTEAEEVVQRRLAEANSEIARWKEYDYYLVNHDFHTSADALACLTRAEQFRVNRV